MAPEDENRRQIVTEQTLDIQALSAVGSNSTFDHGSLSPADIQLFDVFANGGKSGIWLAALDDFRNYLTREAARTRLFSQITLPERASPT